LICFEAICFDEPSLEPVSPSLKSQTAHEITHKSALHGATFPWWSDVLFRVGRNWNQTPCVWNFTAIL